MKDRAVGVEGQGGPAGLPRQAGLKMLQAKWLVLRTGLVWGDYNCVSRLLVRRFCVDTRV
jgi:hypothetical protein